MLGERERSKSTLIPGIVFKRTYRRSKDSKLVLTRLVPLETKTGELEKERAKKRKRISSWTEFEEEACTVFHPNQILFEATP